MMHTLTSESGGARVVASVSNYAKCAKVGTILLHYPSQLTRLILIPAARLTFTFGQSAAQLPSRLIFCRLAGAADIHALLITSRRKVINVREVW